MDLGFFVVAFALIAGIGLMAFGRMPFPTRRAAPDAKSAESETETAGPPGRVDDSG